MALFANKFHFNIQEFEDLEPAQASKILEHANEMETNRMAFFQHEFRNLSYFIVKSSFGDTKQIRKPSDLYTLHNEAEKTIPNNVFIITENDKKLFQMLCGDQPLN